MAIVLNGVTFSDGGGTAVINNTALESIHFGATEVWSSGLVIYENGDPKTGVTGGWVQYLGAPAGGSFARTDGTDLNSDTVMQLHFKSSSGDGYSYMIPTNKINVTDYNKLHMLAYSTGTYNNSTNIKYGSHIGFIGLYDRTGPYVGAGQYAGAGIIQWLQIAQYNTYCETVMDITARTGSYYIGPVQRANTSRWVDMYIKKIWLTK